MNKLGKKPATYDSRDLKLADLGTSALPPIPSPHGGYGTDFSNWGMAGNGPIDPDDHSLPASWTTAAQEGAGDCTCAGTQHEEMEASHNAGAPVPTFNAKTALDLYITITGQSGTPYNPETGDGDTGLEVRSVLQYRQKTGILDASGQAHKIGTYVALEPGNPEQLWTALWLFECVGIGIEFPESAMDQFNAHQAWSVVPGAEIEGGHYIPLVGHPSSNLWTCVTWGRRQMVTPQFLAKYCDEAWCYIDPLRYSKATGETLQDYTDADLEKYIAAVAAEKAAE